MTDIGSINPQIERKTFDQVIAERNRKRNDEATSDAMRLLRRLATAVRPFAKLAFITGPKESFAEIVTAFSTIASATRSKRLTPLSITEVLGDEILAPAQRTAEPTEQPTAPVVEKATDASEPPRTMQGRVLNAEEVAIFEEHKKRLREELNKRVASDAVTPPPIAETPEEQSTTPKRRLSESGWFKTKLYTHAPLATAMGFLAVVTTLNILHPFIFKAPVKLPAKTPTAKETVSPASNQNHVEKFLAEQRAMKAAAGETFNKLVASKNTPADLANTPLPPPASAPKLAPKSTTVSAPKEPVKPTDSKKPTVASSKPTTKDDSKPTANEVPAFYAKLGMSPATYQTIDPALKAKTAKVLVGNDRDAKYKALKELSQAIILNPKTSLEGVRLMGSIVQKAVKVGDAGNPTVLQMMATLGEILQRKCYGTSVIDQTMRYDFAAIDLLLAHKINGLQGHKIGWIETAFKEIQNDINMQDSLHKASAKYPDQAIKMLADKQTMSIQYMQTYGTSDANDYLAPKGPTKEARLTSATIALTR